MIPIQNGHANSKLGKVLGRVGCISIFSKKTSSPDHMCFTFLFYSQFVQIDQFVQLVETSSFD